MVKTEEFMNNIEENGSISKLEGEFIPKDFGFKLLEAEIIKSGIKPGEIAKVITPTDKNGYKYLNNTRKMQRNILIKICIVCNFNLKTTNLLLKYYRFPELYPKMKQDYIIIQGIKNKWSLEEINRILSIEEEPQL